MDTEQAYNIWSEQYDTNNNRTRDLEAVALRLTLKEIQFENCLEIGCGTGKNTEWLLTQTKQVTAVDFSEKMLAKAREKTNSGKVQFIQADITKNWNFVDKQYELVCFSLILEHIENLDSIFNEASNATVLNGYVYIGELHPYRQYSGTKAGFETEDGQQIAICFNHNVSDFIQTAKKYCFEIVDINEYFDENDRTNMPRILTILLKKNKP